MRTGLAGIGIERVAQRDARVGGGIGSSWGKGLAKRQAAPGLCSPDDVAHAWRHSRPDGVVGLLRGEAAQDAVRAVLDAVGPFLPAGVDLEIVGTPRAWRLRSQHAAGEHRGIWDVSRNDSGGLALDSGNVVLFGIGALIPCLPARLGAKLNAISALELIQDAVADVTGAPWPGPGYEVRSRIAGAAVNLWFERDTDGHRIALFTVPRALFHRSAADWRGAMGMIPQV